jgi:ABC-type tungstate transport system permease subunit
MVNPIKCPNTNSNDAKKFIKWLISSNGQEQIKNFKVKNQQLFFPNAN